jgi:hypothetical protein
LIAGAEYGCWVKLEGNVQEADKCVWEARVEGEGEGERTKDEQSRVAMFNVKRTQDQTKVATG